MALLNKFCKFVLTNELWNRYLYILFQPNLLYLSSILVQILADSFHYSHCLNTLANSSRDSNHYETQMVYIHFLGCENYLLKKVDNVEHGLMYSHQHLLQYNYDITWLSHYISLLKKLKKMKKCLSIDLWLLIIKIKE